MNKGKALDQYTFQPIQKHEHRNYQPTPFARKPKMKSEKENYICTKPNIAVSLTHKITWQ
jgi:hypothetical protein